MQSNWLIIDDIPKLYTFLHTHVNCYVFLQMLWSIKSLHGFCQNVQCIYSGICNTFTLASDQKNSRGYICHSYIHPLHESESCHKKHADGTSFSVLVILHVIVHCIHKHFGTLWTTPILQISGVDHSIIQLTHFLVHIVKYQGSNLKHQQIPARLTSIIFLGLVHFLYQTQLQCIIYGLRSMANGSLLFSSSIRCPSLDLFRRSFIGAISGIWAATPAELRLRGADQGWSTILKLLQKYMCVKCLCRCYYK